MEYLGAESGQRLQRLEKADVLEVTVNHLRGLKAEGRLLGGETEAGDQRLANPSTYRSGYSACAAEVRKISSTKYIQKFARKIYTKNMREKYARLFSGCRVHL